MSLNDMDSPESGNGKFAFPNMGDEPKVISQVSLDSFAETADSIDDGAALTVNASKKRHLLWLWIVLAVMLLLGAVAGGGRYDNMVGKFLGTQVPAVGFSIGFERVCGILLEQGYQIPGAKQKIALLYGKDADFTAVLAKAADLRSSYNVTVLQQAKKLGKQLGQLEASGFSGAAFMDKDEIKIFAQQ